MKLVNMHEAKTHLSRLVEAAAQGEEIVIARGGKPVARLVGWTEKTGPRPFGTMKGRIHLGEDFDAPLPPEIQAGFDGNIE